MFLFGYNRSVFAERVRDVLTAVVNLRDNAGCRDIRLCGWGWAGPVAVVAGAAAGPAVTRLAADADGFRFDAVTDLNDPMLLPGAVKYGGLPGIAALCAPDAAAVAPRPRRRQVGRHRPAEGRGVGGRVTDN